MHQIVNKPHLGYRSKINIMTHQSMIGRPFVVFIFPSEDDRKVETAGQ